MLDTSHVQSDGREPGPVGSASGGSTGQELRQYPPQSPGAAHLMTVTPGRKMIPPGHPNKESWSVLPLGSPVGARFWRLKT